MIIKAIKISSAELLSDNWKRIEPSGTFYRLTSSSKSRIGLQEELIRRKDMQIENQKRSLQITENHCH